LLIDELGYVALRQPDAHLLFQVISRRHDRKKPTVITSNRIPQHWNQVFTDTAVAHAILDRLAERAEVFHVEGQSYRKPTAARAEGAPLGAARVPASDSTGPAGAPDPGRPAPVCLRFTIGHVPARAGQVLRGGNWSLSMWRFHNRAPGLGAPQITVPLGTTVSLGMMTMPSRM